MSDERIRLNLSLNENTIQAVENRVRNLVNQLSTQNIRLNIDGQSLNSIINQINTIRQQMQTINTMPVNINANLTQAQQQYRLETERIRVAQQLSVERERTLQTENRAIRALAEENRTMTINRNITADINGNLQHTHEHIRNANNATNDFATGLGRSLQYILQYRVITEMLNQITEAYRELKAVDSSMVGYRKVTGASKSEVNALTKDAFANASKYGRLASEYAESTERFAKAGYNDKSSQLSELALLAEGVGDIDNELANEFLIAADASWKLNGNVTELTKILDMFNELSNRTATDVGKLSAGITVSGSMFAQAGLSAQDYAAIIGTATSKTARSGEEMSRAWRTIIMNLSQIRGTDIETGEIIDEDKLAKAEKTLNAVGIQIREIVNGQNELRNPMNVLKEIAEKWESLSSIQQSALAESVSNKRQSNAFISVIENWKDVEKAIEITSQSSNSAIREHEIYMDSWSAKQKQMTAEWAEFISHMSNVETIKGTLDVLSAGINALDTPIGRIVVQATLMNTAFTLTGRLFNALRARNIIADILATGVAERDLSTAINLVNSHLLEQIRTWAMSPLGLGTIAVGSIMLIAKAVDYFTVSLKESQEALNNSIQKHEEAVQKVQELTEEIKKYDEQISAMESKSLTPIEDAELNKLKTAREEAELLLNVQNELEAKEQKEKSDQAIKTINTKVSGQTRLDILNGLKAGYDNTEAEIDYVTNYSGYSDEEKSKSIEYLRKHQENLKKQALELSSTLLEEAKALDLADESANELNTTIQELASNTLSWASAETGSSQFGDTAKQINENTTALSGSIDTLNASLTNVSKSETDLKTISDVVNGKLYLTNEEISALTKKYPDLANKIKLTTKGWTLESSAMDVVEDSVLDLQTSYVSAQNAISEALSSQMAQRINGLSSELLAVQTVAEAYAILAQTLTDDLGTHFTKNELRTRGFSKEKQEIIDFVTGLGKAREASAKALEKLNELQNSGLGKNPSGGSSKNDPKYSDPTDAIINRINAEANQLAKQGEIIESNLDLIDSEKDYAKAIDETNNLISNRTSQINALKLANSKLHNEAEKARNSNSYTNEESWFDADGDETEAFHELMNSIKTDDAQEKLQNEFNKIQKFKKAYLENEKLIQDLTKENIKSIEDISDIASKALENHFDERNEISERWIQTQTDFDQLAIDGQIEAYARMVRNNREFLKEIEKNEHLSAEERDRLWKETSNKIVDYQLEAYSLVKKAIQQYGEEVEKGYDIRISRLNSESSLLSTHFDLINAISEEQHNLNKELAEAEVAGAKMNKIERQTLFTKEEHAKLTDKLNGLLGDAVAIQSNYLSELETATKETIEEITNNYERQYELKMKEYEVVKAELALVKAEQKLKNVENEKSVRTWDGTKWVYEADFQDVVDAKLAVEDAKYAVWQAQTSQAQQNALNAIDSTADSLETQKNLFTKTLEELSEGTKITGQQLTDALKYIAEVDLPTFEKIIEQFGDSLADAFDVDTDNTIKYKSSSKSTYADTTNEKYNGGWVDSLGSGVETATAYLPSGIKTTVHIKDGKTQETSLPKGTIISTSGGDYKITGGTGGENGYTSEPVTKRYALGTKDAQKGLGIFDENGIGSEYVLTKDGILHNFNMGDKVFNPKMGDNLYEAAQIDWKKVSLADFGGLASVDNSIRNMSSDTYYNVNGVNINSEEGGEIKGFVKFLKAKKI